MKYLANRSVIPPKIKGLERFKGNAFHSANWDEAADFSNKRIGVTGSGASAIQFVSELQKKRVNQYGQAATAGIKLRKGKTPIIGQDFV